MRRVLQMAVAGAILAARPRGDVPAASPVALSRIAGFRPAVAVTAHDEVFVAGGYFVQLPSFPLTTDPRGVDDASTNCSLRRPFSFRGRARAKPLGAINLAAIRSPRKLRLIRGLLTSLLIDAHTRFHGLERKGVAYVGDGQRLRVTAQPCTLAGSTAPMLIARRIVAAGPIVAPTSAEEALGSDWRHGRRLAATLTGVVVAAGGSALAAMLLYRRR